MIKRFYVRILAKDSVYDEYIKVYVHDKFAICTRTNDKNKNKYISINNMKDFPKEGFFWILKNYGKYYIGFGKDTMEVFNKKELKSAYHNYKFNNSFEDHLLKEEN